MYFVSVGGGSRFWDSYRVNGIDFMEDVNIDVLAEPDANVNVFNGKFVSKSLIKTNQFLYVVKYI